MKVKISCGQRSVIFETRKKKASSLIVKLLQACVEHGVSIHCAEDILL